MTIFRYIVAVCSLMMLAVTLNAPGSQWIVDFRIFNYHVQGNFLYWLFSISTVIYIPLLISSTIIFAGDLLALLKDKISKCRLSNLLIFSTLNLVALYRFNHWIFSEIF